MKKVLVSVMILLAAGTALMAQTGEVSVIGDFLLESGDGKKLAAADLSGMVTVLFYETKDNKELNRPAKDRLNSLFHSVSDDLRARVIRLSVIDCTAAAWPFTGIWKKQLVKNSKIEGMDVYGDWDGKMREAFAFEKKEAYLVVIDQYGTVCFFKKGQQDQAAIDAAEKTIMSLFPVSQ